MGICLASAKKCCNKSGVGVEYRRDDGSNNTFSGSRRLWARSLMLESSYSSSSLWVCWPYPSSPAQDVPIVVHTTPLMQRDARSAEKSYRHSLWFVGAVLRVRDQRYRAICPICFLQQPARGTPAAAGETVAKKEVSIIDRAEKVPALQ